MTMVRMRYHYPPRTPVLKPQRFPVGTRVANPIEARTGTITSFDGQTGVYHLVFSDGHEQDVIDDQVDRFVVGQRPVVAVDDDIELTSESVGIDTTPDPLHLLHAVVHKVVRSYEGMETTITGSVAAYLPETDRYRIVYENSLLEDMTPDETKTLTDRTKRKADGLDHNGDDDATIQARKRHKSAMDIDSEPPLNARGFPSRTAAYTILRKSLRAIIAQDDAKKLITEKQRAVVKNDEIKAKKALEHFVDADGLKLLQKLLVHWMKRTETHAGAMMVLKILAALPGITAEAVLSSHIGKTLRGISRVSRELDHVDSAFGDLAEWVIRTWRRQVSVHASVKTSAAQHTAEVKGTVLPALYVAPKAAQQKLKERESMTAHLRQLMSAPAEPVETEDKPEFFIVEYGKLGSQADKRRPMRQIIHIESLVERVRKKKEDDKDGESKEEEDEEIQPDDGQRRIRFRRREEKVVFKHDVEPYRLLATVRTDIIDANRERAELAELGPPPKTSTKDSSADDSVKRLPPPNKRTAPVKSILKNRTQVNPVEHRMLEWE